MARTAARAEAAIEAGTASCVAPVPDAAAGSATRRQHLQPLVPAARLGKAVPSIHKRTRAARRGMVRIHAQITTFQGTYGRDQRTSIQFARAHHTLQCAPLMIAQHVSQIHIDPPRFCKCKDAQARAHQGRGKGKSQALGQRGGAAAIATSRQMPAVDGTQKMSSHGCRH